MAADNSVPDITPALTAVNGGALLAWSRYDAGLDRAMVDGMIAAFADVEPVAPDTTGQSPIFIVGLPRTGTTLRTTPGSRTTRSWQCSRRPAAPGQTGCARDRRCSGFC